MLPVVAWPKAKRLEQIINAEIASAKKNVEANALVLGKVLIIVGLLLYSWFESPQLADHAAPAAQGVRPNALVAIPMKKNLLKHLRDYPGFVLDGRFTYAGTIRKKHAIVVEPLQDLKS
jgi:hypothetical protein